MGLRPEDLDFVGDEPELAAALDGRMHMLRKAISHQFGGRPVPRRKAQNLDQRAQGHPRSARLNTTCCHVTLSCIKLPLSSLMRPQGVIVLDLRHMAWPNL